MSDIKFPNGVNIKTVQTKYGEIIKVGVHTEKMFENPMNNQWVNFDIRKGKNGKWYCALNEYKKEEQTQENIVQIVEVDESEIPF